MSKKNDDKLSNTNDLFRKEAIEAQKKKSDGVGLIATPLSFYILNSSLLLIIVIVVIFLNYTQYSRKELVTGRLVPTGDYARVYSTKKGIISDLFVKEGQLIAQGEPIALITSDVYTTQGVKLTSMLSSEFNKTEDIIRLGLKHEQKLTESVLLKLEDEIKFKVKELEGIIDLVDINVKKRDLSHSKFEKFKKLYNKELVSQSKYEESFYAFLTDDNELNRILNEKTVIESQIARMKAELEVERLTSQRKITDLKLRLSQTIREEAISKSDDTYLIKAPLSGIISGLQVRKGQQSSATTQLLTILPNNDGLEVELFVPTRAISYISKETIIKIRYNSFPYQKYGTFSGNVKSISKSVIKATQLDGYTGNEEWLYKLTVTLNDEDYRNGVYLKPGMELSAYLLGEKRTVFEWIFEPLLTVKSNIL